MTENKGEQPEQEISFDDYMKTTREEFVSLIVKHFPHEYKKEYPTAWAEIRVAAEDLILCFDQMKVRLQHGGIMETAVQPSKVQENEIDGLRQQLNESLLLYQNMCDQITKDQQEIERLKAWKESAISVMPDMQAIGKALNVPLGQSVHDKILPGIQRLNRLIEMAIKKHTFPLRHEAAINEFKKENKL